jgi:hypothetical protein
MRQRPEDEVYLKLLKDGHNFKFFNIITLTHKNETEYEHWTSSLVRTGRHFSARRQSPTKGAFPGHISASLEFNAHLAISVGAQPPPL